jgi:predicted dehydrogenase
MAIDYSGHTRTISAFLDALDSGDPVPVPGFEGRKSVAIIEAIYESAATGQPVEID